MKIAIQANRTISEFQKEFQKHFPYLNVEFFTRQHAEGESSRKEDMLPQQTTFGSITNSEGEVEIAAQLTTADVERILREKFNLNAQIFRRSGSVWIETSKTDDWTLEFQNEEGKKSTEPIEEEKLDWSDRDTWE